MENEKESIIGFTGNSNGVWARSLRLGFWQFYRE
jgi:hypothetical protein